MIFNISSTKNEKYKIFKALKNKKARTEYNLYTVEGIKSVEDAIKSDEIINSLIMSETFYNENGKKYSDELNLYVVSDSIFESLASTETPQGIIAVLEKKNLSNIELSKEKAYIYCDHIQDPGNLGTIIRTADAAGFGGVLMSELCVDLYNPKTVRASMGSFFHIKKALNVTKEKLLEYKKMGFLIVCGVLSDNTVEYTVPDYKKPVIIVVGNEANGITEDILKISDIDVKIPIDGDAESLNASIAAAIMMYEVRRQRNE